MSCVLNFHRRRAKPCYHASGIIRDRSRRLEWMNISKVERELVAPLLQIVIRRYDIPGASRQLGVHGQWVMFS